MPAQITCDMCGDEPAVAMVTNLANGDTLTIGESCQPTFHLTVAAELLGSMPAEAASEYAAMVGKLVTAAAAANLPGGGDLPASPAAAAATDPAPPAPTEGPADEHATAEPGPAADTTGQPADEHDADHRSGRGGARRPA